MPPQQSTPATQSSATAEGEQIKWQEVARNWPSARKSGALYQGYANPDGPAVPSVQSVGKGVEYVLPKASLTVLKGAVQ
jgi:hypothetical protein